MEKKELLFKGLFSAYHLKFSFGPGSFPANSSALYIGNIKRRLLFYNSSLFRLVEISIC